MVSYMIIIIPTGSAARDQQMERNDNVIPLRLGRPYSLVGAIAVGELYDVVADIHRPVRNQAGKTPPVIGKQGARGFLEIGEVAGHRRHEVIGRIARDTLPVAIAADAAGFIDQFAQARPTRRRAGR